MAVLLTGPAALEAGPGLPHKTWTRDEVKVLQSTGLFDGTHFELIDGELIDKMGKHRPHIVCLWRVVETLEIVFGKGFVQQEAPVEIAEADERTNEPEPDACVLRGRIESYTEAPKPADVILVVEVADSTLHHDLTAKAAIYARACFADYWVADVNGRTLHVLRDPADGEYRIHLELGESESIEPLAAPGHSIRVADLLP